MVLLIHLWFQIQHHNFDQTSTRPYQVGHNPAHNATRTKQNQQIPTNSNQNQQKPIKPNQTKPPSQPSLSFNQAQWWQFCNSFDVLNKHILRPLRTIIFIWRSKTTLPGVLVFLTVLICVVGGALDGTDGDCQKMEISSSFLRDTAKC